MNCEVAFSLLSDFYVFLFAFVRCLKKAEGLPLIKEKGPVILYIATHVLSLNSRPRQLRHLEQYVEPLISSENTVLV